MDAGHDNLRAWMGAFGFDCDLFDDESDPLPGPETSLMRPQQDDIPT